MFREGRDMLPTISFIHFALHQTNCGIVSNYVACMMNPFLVSCTR